MLAILGYLALTVWIANHVSMIVAGFMIIGGIVFFLWLGHSIEMDEWKARCNRRKFWRDQGPY